MTPQLCDTLACGTLVTTFGQGQIKIMFLPHQESLIAHNMTRHLLFMSLVLLSLGLFEIIRNYRNRALTVGWDCYLGGGGGGGGGTSCCWQGNSALYYTCFNCDYHPLICCSYAIKLQIFPHKKNTGCHHWTGMEWCTAIVECVGITVKYVTMALNSGGVMILKGGRCIS